MASSSGTSSGSMDLKKRKRMVSNRDSARRSRIRKQKHLDDLLTQVGQLSGENSHMVTSMKFTGQMYLNVDAENSILKTQLAELTHRLDSLNQIMDCLNSTGGLFETDSFLNPWSSFRPTMTYPIV